MKAGAQRWKGGGVGMAKAVMGGGTIRRDLGLISLTLLRALKRDFAT